MMVVAKQLRNFTLYTLHFICAYRRDHEPGARGENRM